MRLLFRSNALLFCLALLAQSVWGATPATSALLDGVWEGSLERANKDPDKTPIKVRLNFDQGKVEVFFEDEEKKWDHIKPGKFGVVQRSFNAVISTIDTEPRACWDETMVFAVALTNENKLMTQFSRVVSNIRCMLPDAATFSMSASGDLQRTGPSRK
jgi:hypothetical protein